MLVCQGRHVVYVAQRVTKRAALTTDRRDSDGVVRYLGDVTGTGDVIGEAGFVLSGWLQRPHPNLNKTKLASPIHLSRSLPRRGRFCFVRLVARGPDWSRTDARQPEAWPVGFWVWVGGGARASLSRRLRGAEWHWRSSVIKCGQTQYLLCNQ